MIKSKKHLLSVIKTNPLRLEYILENIDKFYYSFDIVKINKETGEPKLDKEGNIKKRKINSSTEELKKIQKRISNYIKSISKLPDYFYGGVKKRDNIKNAKYHQGNKYIFTTDLKDFFPSISYKQVYQILIELDFAPDIARIITKLTTKNFQIPQGVPTSTLLANLVFRKTGDKIFRIAKENHLKFSIFVDDLTISSPKDFKSLTLDIIDILKKDGYRISHDKTFYKTDKPQVTGIRVYNDKIKCLPIYKRILKNTPKDKLNDKRIKGIKAYTERISKA